MKRTLFVINEDDRNYLQFLKPYLGGLNCKLLAKKPDTLAEMTIGFDAVVICREDLLEKFAKVKKGLKLDNYAGSLYKRGKTEFLILPDLQTAVSKRAGKHLLERYLTKITKPQEWFPSTEFNWQLLDKEEEYADVYALLGSALLIAIDIETVNEPVRRITCASYTGLFRNTDGSYYSKSFVVPFTSMFRVEWARKFNALPNPKIFQNGFYDNAWFQSWGMPVTNWAFDTQELFHAWYSELPKRLDFQTMYFVRESYFWKNDGKSGDLQDYYEYNARDGWATLNAWLAMMAKAPKFALRNYGIKFKYWMPCFVCGMTGVKIDPDRHQKLLSEQQTKLAIASAKLGAMVGKPRFNPASPVQMLSLLHALGYKVATGTDRKIIQKAMDAHPLNAHILSSALAVRESKKLLGTYLEQEFLGGRWMYQLKPSGTDTLRLASSESYFWCGTQIQNAPAYTKDMVIADDGFYLGEIDYSQSEARCVAYLSGDQNLIETVESDKDYHGLNGARFFGLPYESIVATDGTVLLPDIRNLAKRTNHGSNYNMGERVLLETMGAKNVIRAKNLLGLPSVWSLLRVCQYLLDSYVSAYPRVKGAFYDYIKACVATTKLLVSELGWTRYCFGNPSARKPDLNAYVAHVPSNLSVGIINEGFSELFWTVQMREWNNFRLLAQIHDSIFFQYRIGHDRLLNEVKTIMRRPMQVRDCSNVVRTMVIPAELKAGGTIWSQLKKVKENDGRKETV